MKTRTREFVSAEAEDALELEVERRIAGVESGLVAVIPLEDALAQVRLMLVDGLHGQS